jgi:hypothetical protein
MLRSTFRPSSRTTKFKRKLYVLEDGEAFGPLFNIKIRSHNGPKILKPFVPILVRLIF